MRIAVGSDHRDHAIRSIVIQSVVRVAHQLEDVGTHDNVPVDYPGVTSMVARKVSMSEVDRGILIGRTGLGMTIVANKFPGVRAAPCHDELTAEMSRRHNDLNVLCLSADLLSEPAIVRIVETWLNAPFDGGRHARRVEKIGVVERER